MFDKLIMSFGIKWLANAMNGYKTYFGGAVLILLGLGKIGVGLVGLVSVLYPDVVSSSGATPVTMDVATGSLQAGAASFAVGLSACGIGHKIEKQGAPNAQ